MAEILGTLLGDLNVEELIAGIDINKIMEMIQPIIDYITNLFSSLM